MWRPYVRELPAILILSALAVGGLCIAWSVSEPPGQKPAASTAIVVGFHAPTTKLAWARRDPTTVVTVRFANGTRRTTNMLLSLTQACRVGDTVTVREATTNAGLRRLHIASACAPPKR